VQMRAFVAQRLADWRRRLEVGFSLAHAGHPEAAGR
jgi:hypothetical protein